MDYYKEENSNEFILAVRSKDSVLSFLLRRGTVEQLNYSNDNGYTALHLSIMFGTRYNDVTEKIIGNEKVDVNTINNFKKFDFLKPSSPLLSTCETKNIEVLKMLLKRKDLDVNKDVGGITPFQILLENTELEMIKLYLSRPDFDINRFFNIRYTSPNLKDSYINFSIMIALSSPEKENSAEYEIIREILKRDDVNVNITTPESKDTIIYEPIERHNFIIPEMLLQRKDLDINHKNSVGKTAFQVLFDKILLEDSNILKKQIELISMFLERTDMNISSLPIKYPIDISNDELRSHPELSRIYEIWKKIDTIKKKYYETEIKEKTASESSRRLEDKRKAETSSSNVVDCPICLDECNEGDKCITLPRCGHFVHKSCLIQLEDSKRKQSIEYYNGIDNNLPYNPSRTLGGSLRCPICKTDILSYEGYDKSNYLDYYNNVLNLANTLDGMKRKKRRSVIKIKNVKKRSRSIKLRKKVKLSVKKRKSPR